MSKLKLLAFGRSLAAARDRVGRYQVREAARLPSFTRPAAARAAEPEPTDSRPGWWHRLVDRWRREPVAPAGPEVVAIRGDGQRIPAGPGRPARAWRPGAEDAQREFRFENVRAICNDLSGCDLDILRGPGKGVLWKL